MVANPQIPPLTTETGDLYKSEVYETTDTEFPWSVETTKLDPKAPEIPDQYFDSKDMAEKFAKEVAGYKTHAEAQELIDHKR